MTKEPFSFSYTEPFSDWYRTIDVVIQPDDYYYFKIERRLGSSWWLIGSNPKDKPKYHWEENQIGEISEPNLRRFIEWAKDGKGSRIIEFKAVSSDYDIIEEITRVLA